MIRKDIYLSGYDALAWHNKMQFTTYDHDNDGWKGGNCAASYGNAGNWYNACRHQSLMGRYGVDGDKHGEFMIWYYFDTENSQTALKKMRWMIREVV